MRRRSSRGSPDAELWPRRGDDVVELGIEQIGLVEQKRDEFVAALDPLVRGAELPCEDEGAAGGHGLVTFLLPAVNVSAGRRLRRGSPAARLELSG